jgi:hypothetical protein
LANTVKEVGLRTCTYKSLLAAMLRSRGLRIERHDNAQRQLHAVVGRQTCPLLLLDPALLE